MPIAEWVKIISGLGTFASMYPNLPEGRWQGWDTYLKGLCQRENFRRLWRELGYEFDKGFMDYIGRQTGRLTS